MTLEPSASGHLAPAPSVEWMLTSSWDSGYPRITEDIHSVAAVRVSEIGASKLGETRHQAGRTMKMAAKQVIGAALASGQVDSFEIRVVAEPADGASSHTRLYFIAKCAGQGEAATAVVQASLTAAAMCLPKSFHVEPVDRPGSLLSEWTPSNVLEIQRIEHVTAPQWDFIPSDYYYHLESIEGDGSGWSDVWHTLSRVPSPVAICYTFKPALMTAPERNALGGIITDLELFAHDRVEPNLIGYDDFYPGDKNADVAARAWRERIAQLGPMPILGRIMVSGYGPVVDAVAAQLVAAIQLREGVRGDSLCIIGHDHLASAEIEHVARTIREMEIWPVDTMEMWRLRNPPLILRRFQYLFGPDEAAAACVLPVPDANGVPGFVLGREDLGKRVTQYRSAHAGPAVRIGSLRDQGRQSGPALLPLAALNRHTLVVGVQGYGKTTAVLTVLARLWREHKVPWLVIEPTRPEYRGLLNRVGMDDLRVFTLGRDDINPLRLNPLEPPPGVRCEVHQSALMSIFRMAMPLLPPLPDLLMQALERCYLVAGWAFDTQIGQGVPAPSLRDLAHAFDDCFREADYRGDARNVSSAFAVRLRGLLAGGTGRMLDTAASSDLAELMSVPTIFEMRDLENAEDKALMAALLLHRVRSHAMQLGPSSGALRHVTVVEEAHRVLPSMDDSRGSAESGDNTRALAAEDFVNAISEMRSLGEAFILSTQRPSRLTQSAVGSTNTRLVFQLTDETDRAKMLADMGGSPTDSDLAPRLRQGECLARWYPLDRPELVVIEPAEGVDTASVPTDQDVTARMREHAERTRHLLPYVMCSRAICSGGCSPSVRAAGRALELRTRSSVRDSAFFSDQSLPLEGYVKVLATQFALHATSPAMTYCAVVHSLLERRDYVTLGLNAEVLRVRRSQIERNVIEAHGGVGPVSG